MRQSPLRFVNVAGAKGFVALEVPLPEETLPMLELSPSGALVEQYSEGGTELSSP
jgi:hypothetical protein